MEMMNLFSVLQHEVKPIPFSEKKKRMAMKIKQPKTHSVHSVKHLFANVAGYVSGRFEN